jgi:hypothetical protein
VEAAGGNRRGSFRDGSRPFKEVRPTPKPPTKGTPPPIEPSKTDASAETKEGDQKGSTPAVKMVKRSLFTLGTVVAGKSVRMDYVVTMPEGLLADDDAPTGQSDEAQQ